VRQHRSGAAWLGRAVFAGLVVIPAAGRSGSANPWPAGSDRSGQSDRAGTPLADPLRVPAFPLVNGETWVSGGLPGQPSRGRRLDADSRRRGTRRARGGARPTGARGSDGYLRDGLAGRIVNAWGQAGGVLGPAIFAEHVLAHLERLRFYLDIIVDAAVDDLSAWDWLVGQAAEAARRAICDLRQAVLAA
jgi:hypothetical protein